MELLGKLIYYLKKASPDFQFHNSFKKSCSTYIMYSQKLNQVIIVKFPNREHYISPRLATKYLEASRENARKTLRLPHNHNIYILNILISDRLTKSCSSLVTSGNHENMNMLFNPRRTKNIEILRTIFGALAKKFRTWCSQIKKSCNKPISKYHSTSKGIIRKDKIIEPYGPVKEKIANLDRAADILEVASTKSGKGRKK